MTHGATHLPTDELMDKPRFLFVTKYHLSRATGGAEEQCWLLATELARRGWDVHYASEMNQVPEPNVLEGVTLHGLPEDPPWWRGNRLPLRKLMAQLRPDVVYNLAFDLYTGHAMMEAPPGTFTIWADSFSRDGFVTSMLIEWLRLLPPFRFAKRLPVLLYTLHIAKKGCRMADLVLAHRYEKCEQLRRAGLESVVIRNVQPPVPESEVQNHQGIPVVFWIGSAKRVKRPEYFIKLARHCQDLAARFVMVGRLADPEYRSHIEKASAELSGFRYAGFVPLTEVGKCFSQAHIFVGTSLSEGFPNTFIHAWMRGVPVVSLGVDPDRVLQEQGLGVKVSNLNQMEAEIRALVNDPERRRIIGARARSFALKEFDLKTNVDKFESLLAARGVKIPGG